VEEAEGEEDMVGEGCSTLARAAVERVSESDRDEVQPGGHLAQIDQMKASSAWVYDSRLPNYPLTNSVLCHQCGPRRRSYAQLRGKPLESDLFIWAARPGAKAQNGWLSALGFGTEWLGPRVIKRGLESRSKAKVTAEERRNNTLHKECIGKSTRGLELLVKKA
jgi:hypothetical protein